MKSELYDIIQRTIIDWEVNEVSVTTVDKKKDSRSLVDMLVSALESRSAPVSREWEKEFENKWTTPYHKGGFLVGSGQEAHSIILFIRQLLAGRWK